MDTTYNTFKQINKPIRLSGLSPLQFAGIALSIAAIAITLLLMRQHPVMILILLMGFLYLLSVLFSTLNKEHKNGNPNYLQGVSVKNSTPKKILDRCQIFKFIMNKTEQQCKP